MRALVRLDRREMRPGTSGQSGKTVPTCFTDPEVDAPTIVPGSEIWATKYGPTTLERGSRRTPARGRRFLRGRRDDDRTRWSNRHPGGFLHHRRWSGGNWRERGTADIIAGSTSFPTSWVLCCPRGFHCCAEIPRFLRPQPRCKWQRHQPVSHPALRPSFAVQAEYTLAQHLHRVILPASRRAFCQRMYL